MFYAIRVYEVFFMSSRVYEVRFMFRVYDYD